MSGKKQVYWEMLDKIAGLSFLDFCGGIIAGVGINILASLLITEPKVVSVTSALIAAIGFLIGGTFISISRTVLGEIRHYASSAKGKVEYYDKLKIASNVKGKGHIAFSLFCLGLVFSVFSLTWAIIVILA